jgi:hypothetical protein
MSRGTERAVGVALLAHALPWPDVKWTGTIPQAYLTPGLAKNLPPVRSPDPPFVFAML